MKINIPVLWTSMSLWLGQSVIDNTSLVTFTYIYDSWKMENFASETKINSLVEKLIFDNDLIEKFFVKSVVEFDEITITCV